MKEFFENSFGKILAIIYLIFVFLLLILEVVKYPGVTQAYLHININYLLVFAVILFFIFHKKVSKKLEVPIFFVMLISVLTFIFFNIQEQTHFPNYCYSIYHVSILSVRNLAIFLMAFFFSSIVNHQNFRKITGFLFLPSKYKNRWLLYLLFSILFALFIYKDNFKAQWSIIDDHETAYFLGSDKKIGLLEIPNILSKTEVGHFGESTRYRPSYYFLRVVETSVWKDSPLLWYVFRYVILVFFIFGIIYIISNFFGSAGGLIFALYVMIGKYWIDIWTRLGPGEIYVVLGITLLSIGLFKISKSKTPLNKVFPWIIYFIGSMLATGSKENMVILALPSLYLLITQFKNSKFNWRVLLLVTHIIYCLLISVEIFLAVSKSGQNFYADPVSISRIPEVLRIALTNLYSVQILVFTLLTMALLYYVSKTIHQTEEIKTFLKNQKTAIIFAAFSVLVYFSQFVFYLGKWPTGIRYDFPGIFAVQIFWLVPLYILLSYISQTTTFKQKTKNILFLIFNISLFGYLFILTISNGYKPLLDAVKINRIQTNTFTNEMLKLSETTYEHPKYIIIFKSNRPWNYEQIFSLERYLRFESVSNEMSLDYNDDNFDKETGLYKQLSSELKSVSSMGAGKNQEVSFKPFDDLNYVNKCILVSFSGAPNGKCEFKFNF